MNYDGMKEASVSPRAEQRRTVKSSGGTMQNFPTKPDFNISLLTQEKNLHSDGIPLKMIF